jgi:hypothetical protein
LSTYLTVKNNFGFEEYLDKLRVLNRWELWLDLESLLIS